MFKKKNLITKSAFTLLELLVVIGIISVLVAIGTVSYSTAQKKARDAKRQADLHAFQNALEQCYSISSYSYSIITGNGTSTVSFTCTADTNLSSNVTDPTTKTYTVTSSLTAYSVQVTLENSSTFTITNQQ